MAPKPAELPPGAHKELRELLWGFRGRRLTEERLITETGGQISKRAISRIFNPKPQEPLPGWELGFFPVLEALKVDAAGRKECYRLWRAADREAKAVASPRPHEDAEVLGGEGFLETLDNLYGDRFPLVELFGTKAPICVFPAPPAQWTNLEAALGPPPFRQNFPTKTETDPRLWPREYHPDTWHRYADEVAKGEDPPRRYDGATWAFDRLHIQPEGVRIDCVPGRYYRSLATSEYLDKELMKAHKGREHQSVDLSELDYRAWLHREVGGDNVVVDGSLRNAAVSVAATIMIATEDGGYRVLLTPRSEDVATHRYFSHVIPSGIFQPLDTPDLVVDDRFVKNEFNVERTFNREYLEELYDAREYLTAGSRPIYWPEREPEIVRLAAEPAATLYYTGVSVNLLTLRPEICLLVLVTDPTWWERESATADESALSGGRPKRYGWEVVQKEGDLPPGYAWRRYLDLDSSLNPITRKGLQPDFLVPNAAAAIYLALKVASAQIT